VEEYIAKLVLTLDGPDDLFNPHRSIKLEKKMTSACEAIMLDSELGGFMKAIDFVYVDYVALSPCHLILPYNFSKPFATSTVGQVPWGFGMPNRPSVDSSFYIHSYDLTYWERLSNLLIYIKMTYLHKVHMMKVYHN
jgi:hypothetical protein